MSLRSRSHSMLLALDVEHELGGSHFGQGISRRVA